MSWRRPQSLAGSPYDVAAITCTRSRVNRERPRFSANTFVLDTLTGMGGVLSSILETHSSWRFRPEIAVAADTKLVGRHRRLVREWLDRELPPQGHPS